MMILGFRDILYLGGVPCQVEGDEVVAGVEEEGLDLRVGKLEENRLVLRPDQDDAVGVDAQLDGRAVLPVAAVIGGKQGAPVKGVLHHAAQVPHLEYI